MENQNLHAILYGESRGESDDEEEGLDLDSFMLEEFEDNLTSRQLSYPPIPVYNTPIVDRDVKDKLGLLTPMQELSETDDEEQEKQGTRSRGSNRSMNSHNSHNHRNREDANEDDDGFLTPTNNNNSRKVSFHSHSQSQNQIPKVTVDNYSERLQLQNAQSEWAANNRHQISQSPEETDEVWDFLDSSEMDSTAITKSLKSIPPSLLPLTVQAMSNSLTTLRHQLSTLNAISLFGDRLRELPAFETQDLDLSHLIKKLCTMIGESRTPEASLTMARLIRGAGPGLVTSDLLHIINSSSNKRKAPAIDALTYALLTFPRDEFEIEKIAESVCICLWNPKRKIRQAALECLAVIAHVLGPGLAMPFLRELIDENKPPPPIGNPSSAVSARVSRRLLPSPSPMGLVDYALVLPSKQQLNKLSRMEEDDHDHQELDPILNKSDFGADVIWIINGGTARDRDLFDNDWSSNDRTESSANSSKSSSRGSRKSEKQSKALQQRHRDSLKYQEFKREVEYAKKPEHEEENENHHENETEYFETATKSNAYKTMEQAPDQDELLDIKDEDEHENEHEDHDDQENENGGEEHEEDFCEKKSLGEGRDRDSGVSSLKSFRVTSPNGAEVYSNSNTPIPTKQDSENKPKPEEENTVTSPVNSGYIIRKPVMVRTSGNSKKQITHSLGSQESMSTSTSSSRSSTISSASLNEVPNHKPNSNNLKKSVPSRPRLKSYMDPKSGSTNTKSNSTAHVFAPDLPPLANPGHGLTKGLNDLNSTDWETNIEGFRILISLLRHHPEYIQSELHTINMAGIKQLSNLRSQVCRAACLFFKEMFCHLGKLMELDVEKIGEKLLDKTADTNKFIRESSCAALEAMVENLSPTKTIIPLENVGAKHRNSVVKTTTAKMSTVVIRKLGPEKCLTQMGDKILPMLVKFLQEGSLETRTYAKAAISMLMSHGYFDTALRNHVSLDILRHVIKPIEAIKKELLLKHNPYETLHY